ncbi:hypothetical protein [Roseateles toxinivorans]|uniref:hypothetical protein n=1 Tax=Roseateles toxinivorans TaxID=270368 RepID=UPI00106062B1|nr:hypothetical protein [Roseateles toxinivorans]
MKRGTLDACNASCLASTCVGRSGLGQHRLHPDDFNVADWRQRVLTDDGVAQRSWHLVNGFGNPGQYATLSLFSTRTWPFSASDNWVTADGPARLLIYLFSRPSRCCATAAARCGFRSMPSPAC